MLSPLDAVLDDGSRVGVAVDGAHLGDGLKTKDDTATELPKSGLIDANLGGEVLKKRVARKGQGKRGGYRVIVAARKGGKPAEIKKLRKAAKVTQPIFAALLNVSESAVQKWETGQKRPDGAALKLLRVVQRLGLDAVMW